MSQLNPLGLHFHGRQTPFAERTTDVLGQRPLRRILAFAGCSLDELINSPIAKRRVLGYWKLHRQIDRTCEIIDLERQWNPSPKEKRVKRK